MKSAFPRIALRAFSPSGGAAFLAALLPVVAALVWSGSAHAAPDHDEYQFVAAAALLARRGLLPYVDYPYFHTPYLAFADALLFRRGKK